MATRLMTSTPVRRRGSRARLAVWFSITAAGLVSVAAVVSVAQSSGTPQVLAVLAQLAWLIVIVLLVLRSGRASARRDSRLEKLVGDHHRKASRWEWRISDAISRLAGQQPGARPLIPAAPAVRPEDSWKNHPLTQQFMAMGVFDPDYYRAVAVARFRWDVDATSHYLSVGMKKLQSPSPFVDVMLLPEPVRRAMEAGDAVPLLSHLRSAGSGSGPLSDLFHPGEVDAVPAALQRHPGGALGWYLGRADGATLLPIPRTSPQHGITAEAARETLLQHARRIGDERRLTRSREQSTWDDAAERAWLAELDGVAPPEDDLPSVTVIMPVLNRVELVAAAVESVRRQSHERWELVIVDDGSTDGTYELIEAMAQLDSRIRVLRNGGSGVCSARNLGIEAATGQYLAFLDSDNQWLPDFLRNMLRGMLRDGLRAAYSGAVVIREGGQESYRAFSGGLEHLLQLNHIDLNVLMLDAELAREVGGFDVALRRWVDHDFAIRIAHIAEPVLMPFVGCVYEDSGKNNDRITLRESEHWQWVVLGRNWVDWSEVRSAPRVAGRVSVVIPTSGDSAMTVRAARAVLAEGSWDDVEVVIVDNGSNVQVGQQILRAVIGDRRITYRRLPRNMNFAIGCNIGVAHSTGEYILFLNNDTLTRPGALAPLVRRLERGDVVGVQPLLLYPDDTIQTAGTVFVADNALPTHFLVGHPAADGDKVTDLAFSAVTAAALLMRAADVVELEGFDPIFVNGMEDVDLCLRALALGRGRFAVEPHAWVTHLESKTPGRSRNISENRRLFMLRWSGRLPAAETAFYESAGFTAAHIGSDGAAFPAARPILVRSATSPGRRWGIKIGSIPGARGDEWGDTHFAHSLREALERAGETAVIHRHSAHAVPTTAFDDVVLSLRGLTRVRPMPGKVNILWVISHPELVTGEELTEFDLVFAASELWAARMSEETGAEVRPLHQATDVRRFNTEIAPIPHDGMVFVGGTNPDRPRRIVLDAVTTGLPLTVYGPGWHGAVPHEVFGGPYVRNGELCAVYRGSRRVLADHHKEMAEEGFVQNRLFDAVAAGCRVISDPVPGVDEIFGGAVQTYRSPDDLRNLFDDDEVFPDDLEMQEIARRVARDHSFDARARDLIAAVAEGAW